MSFSLTDVLVAKTNIPTKLGWTLRRALMFKRSPPQSLYSDLKPPGANDDKRTPAAASKEEGVQGGGGGSLGSCPAGLRTAAPGCRPF